MIMYQSIRTRRYIEERITAHEPVSSEQKQIETPVAMVMPGIDLAYCDFAPPVIKYTYDADGAEHEHFYRRRCRKDKCGAWDSRNFRCMARKAQDNDVLGRVII